MFKRKVPDNEREKRKDGEGDLLPPMRCGLRGRPQIQHVWLVGVDIAIGRNLTRLCFFFVGVWWDRALGKLNDCHCVCCFFIFWGLGSSETS